MSHTSRSEALTRLQSAIDEIPALQQWSYTREPFDKWRRTTACSVSSIFGHESRRAKEIVAILERIEPEWVYDYPNTPGPIRRIKYRVADLFGADTLLVSMMSEVRSLSPEEVDAKSIDAVDQDTDPEMLEGPSDSISEISKPFDPTEIKIDTKHVTVDLIMKRINQNEIDLNPDFQRNSGIWDRTRQSRLIESLLLRIPIPVFYMAADNEDNWLVVDGLQRLDTLTSFLNTKTLSLQGLPCSDAACLRFVR